MPVTVLVDMLEQRQFTCETTALYLFLSQLFATEQLTTDLTDSHKEGCAVEPFAYLDDNNKYDCWSSDYEVLLASSTRLVVRGTYEMSRETAHPHTHTHTQSSTSLTL